MSAAPAPPPLHVLIAGAGVAAVECALALHDLAGPRVRLTIVAPDPAFELRALRTAEPFSRDHVRRHAVADLAERVGAALVAAPLEAVHPEQHLAVAGRLEIPYDALVVAVGARHRPAFSRALTFTGDASAIDFGGLLADVDEGYTHRVAFVVPPGTTWTLPLYELALMTARQGWGMGAHDLELSLLTPETRPLAMFGPKAADAMADLLRRAGVAFHGDAYVHEDAGGRLAVRPGGAALSAQRVVALPTVEGRAIPGLPTDDHGFLPVDDHGRVAGCDDVYAAGDGTTFPVKQGGIACQQADAIAEALAARAGAPVDPQPFRPVLRGRVLAGRGVQYLETALHGGAGDAPAPELRLWSMARKVDGKYLSPWLEELEGRGAGGAQAPADDEGAVEVSEPVRLR
jgi:sulfide:quinone oxidoreductase